jgi:hypothetical protein
MSKKPETKFKERIRPYLEALPGSWWVKVQQVGIRGTPDFLGCVGGVFVALELKKDSHTEPDPLQLYTLDKIQQAGGVTFIVSPENWNEVYRDLCRLAQAC